MEWEGSKHCQIQGWETGITPFKHELGSSDAKESLYPGAWNSTQWSSREGAGTAHT